MTYGELQTYKVVSKNGDTFFFSVRTPSEAEQKAYQLCLPHQYDYYEAV